MKEFFRDCEREELISMDAFIFLAKVASALVGGKPAGGFGRKFLNSLVQMGKIGRPHEDTGDPMFTEEDLRELERLGYLPHGAFNTFGSKKITTLLVEERRK